MKIVKNDLFDYDNRYIFQYEDGFKFSLDSILLAEYVDIPKKAIILDMCTGNAPVPLIISTKTDNKIYGFEIQKEVADLAIKSIKYNNLYNQITVYNDNIKNIDNYFEVELFDIITCNPPYFKDSIKNLNKNDLLTIARHEIKINLDDIFSIASKFLKQGGYFYLVHRPERLDDIIELGIKYKLPIKEIQLVTTKENNEPSILLVKCRKNGKQGIKFNKIVCINGVKTYKNIFE